jgi:hypothetical protein
MSDLTTIKVPKELRMVVMEIARAEGLTAAELIRRLIEDHKRQARMAEVRKAYADVRPDEDYADLTVTWDEAAADGLRDA